MPPVTELSSTQVNTVRSGGYAGEVRIAVDPSPVVFQCEVDETITNSVFLSFAWLNTLQGDFEDVEPDMTVYITATDDPAELRNPLWRGRAPRVPTADTFYVNESSFNLITGYIVTVLNTYEPLQKDRAGALVDGYQTYLNVAPAVKNLQSFYYGESIGSLTFSFAPTGQAMAHGSSIASYAWTIPGATYLVGNASTQNITVRVPYGHRWSFLDVTDSNGVSTRFRFEILVCTRDDPDFMFEAHDDVQINGDIETGWNASVSYFAGVEALLNRTRCAILAFDNYKSGSGTFSNVAFVGYLVTETTDITADLISSTLAETRFEIQSFSALAAQLPVPSLAVRNVASPAAWEQIAQPTTQRVIWHLLTRYSTLGNLTAIDFVTTDSTWFGGEMDLEAGTLLESCNRIAEEINASLVFYPQGDSVLEVNANFLSETDRNALPELMASGSITPAGLFSYSLPLPYYDTVGQLECGFASFQTAGTTPVKLSGVAPAVARQEGIESPVVLAQLLNANLTAADAIAAAKQRIADLLEWLNPPTLINLVFHDGWRFLTPSNRVWLTFDLPATDSTRGLPVPPTDRYLLNSISLTWSAAGTFEISGTARLETQGGLSQVNVAISPNEINTDNPILPATSDYDAHVPDGTLNYLTSDPDAADLQPYGRGGYAILQYSPMTTEGAANAADQYPEPGCVVISPPVNFASAGVRTTPTATVNGATYTAFLRGSARIADDAWQFPLNFLQTDGTAYFGVSAGVWVLDEGYHHTDILVPGPVAIRSVLMGMVPPPGVYTRISFTYNLTKGNYTSVQPAVIIFINGSIVESIASNAAADGENLVITWEGMETNPTDIGIQVLSSYDQTNPYDDFTGSCDILSVAFGGTGTNPFTLEPGVEVFTDGLYEWQIIDGEQTAAELCPPNRGFRINSTPVSVPPPFNPQSEYAIEYTGDGNQTPFSYQDDDYTDNANQILYIRVCGENMGN